MVMVMPATAVRRAYARVSASPVSFASEVARKALEFEQTGQDDSPEVEMKWE